MQGIQLFVATAKPRIFAIRIVEHFGLAPFIQAVYGSELDRANADKKNLLAHLLRMESLSAATTVMLGDRALDIVAAKENGVFSIGVLWGYGSREELMAAGAGSLCEEPCLLLDAVSNVNIAGAAVNRRRC
jgi:phosphoglycolate phosphatase